MSGGNHGISRSSGSPLGGASRLPGGPHLLKYLKQQSPPWLALGWKKSSATCKGPSVEVCPPGRSSGLTPTRSHTSRAGLPSPVSVEHPRVLGERPPRRTLDGGTGALPAVACFSLRPSEPLRPATVASKVTGVLQALTGFSLPELRDPSQAGAEPGGHGGHLHQPGGKGPTPGSPCVGWRS